jgi:DNA (cytosine-5)-methyltransferase 1
VPNLGDMTALPARIAARQVPAPDVLCGGTPCQAFSVAGLRKSLDDARGNLSLTFCEIADAIDRARDEPCVVFWENVPGVLNTKDNAFGCFLAGLAGEDDALVPPGDRWADAGVVLGPARTIAWRVLDAQYFGLAQRRRRVFVVASARQGFDPVSVLFEFDGVRRDFAPSREAGESVAPTTGAGAANGGAGHGARSGDSKNELMCSAHSRGDAEVRREAPIIAHSLRGEGFDASEDGTGRGTPIAPVGVTIHGTDGTTSVASYSDVSSCLRARDPGRRDNSTTTVALHPLAFDADHVGPAIAFEPRYYLRDNKTGGAPSGLACLSATNAQRAGDAAPHVATAYRVRRITPEECEALQGFPSGHTAIPYRGKPAADGPRYKALGNSWAVPVVRWIGARIAVELYGCGSSLRPST